ncbi:MAG TPA: glucan biosynthesis glucosyltransferase H, partial [Myxococcota bacterium]
LGGDILSHDFVEAALVLRAGYGVWLDTDDGGSWEEVPAHLDGWAARDRRWCQGSLQHLKVFFSDGFRSASRIHILGGVASYLSSLSWLTLLAVATIDALDRAAAPTVTTAAERMAETALLVGLPLGFLVAPHFLSLAAALRERAAWGGALRVTASAFISLVFALLLAPVSMIIHSVFVTRTLLGQAIGWGAQHRDDTALPWRAGARTAALPTAIGVGWTLLVAIAAPTAVLSLSPVLVSLLLAWPFTIVTSWPKLGLALRRYGLLATPEELDPPAELCVSPLSIEAAVAASEWTPPPAPRMVPLHRLGRPLPIRRPSSIVPIASQSASVPVRRLGA